MEHEAIYNLYPNAVNVNEDGNGGFRAVDIDGNEITIDMSAVNTKATELQTAEDNKSASDRAKQKLRNMGFAEDEVALLIHE